jgi:spore coat polysaccharide biosynthesis protein SpsF
MNNLKIVAIIQARMAAVRLPGKVMLDIAGEPMIARVIERTRRAERVNKFIIATTTDIGDDPLIEFCKKRNYPYERGSMHDVLDRYYQAAKIHQADVIVRITADCPLIDPHVIDLTVNAFLGQKAEQIQTISSSTANSLAGIPFDFAANRLPPPWGRTYPIGLDTEVCSFQALEIAWHEARAAHQREHVMPYFYDHRERFRIVLIDHEVDYGYLRLTVDTPEDLQLVREIYAHFHGNDNFSWLEVVDLLQKKPELIRINSQVRHKTYNEIDDRRENDII